MTGQEGRTGWGRFNSRHCHCSSQMSTPMKLEINQVSLYPALSILKYSLSLQQNKPQILEFYRKKNTYHTRTANSYSSAHFQGLRDHVLDLALPNSDNKLKFVTIFPQFFYSAIPPCWAPLILGFLFSLKKKK